MNIKIVNKPKHKKTEWTDVRVLNEKDRSAGDFGPTGKK
jgi:hypothetical protein